MSSTFRPRLGAVLCLAAGAFASPALAADVLLENVTQVDGDATLTFRSIEVKDTNLTREDLGALFAGKLDTVAGAALVEKMKAAKVSIPELQLAVKGGTITLHDIVATDIDSGKAGRVALASADGALVTDDGQPLAFHANALAIEGLSVSGLVAAAKTDDATALMLHTRQVTFAGLEGTAADTDTPKDAVGGNLWHLRLGSADATTTWDGDVPLVGKAAMKNFVIEPPRASTAGRTLASYGWDRLDFGLTISGAYDPAARAYTIDDYTLSEAKSGSLTLTTRIGSIDKAVFTGAKETRLVALLNGDVSNVVLRFDNAGLFEKAVDFFGSSQKMSPAAVRKQWSAMATQFIPFMLAGDPAGLKIASAVNAFIAQPTRLEIKATAKGEPIKFMDLAAMKDDPGELLARAQLDASAGN